MERGPVLFLWLTGSFNKESDGRDRFEAGPTQ